MNTPVKAVFFDVGNTLMRFNYGAVADALGLADAAPIAALGPLAWSALNSELESSRVLSGTETLRFLFARLVPPALATDNEDAVASILQRTSTLSLWNIVDEDSRAAVCALKERGVRVAVISNADGVVEQLLLSHGWEDYFEFVVDSALVGASKPDPRIFEIALNRMGVDAAEAAYVGDIPAIDVRGAARAGMRPVLYDPHGSYHGALSELTASVGTDVLLIKTMSELTRSLGL